jgi:hypothetical protein
VYRSIRWQAFADALGDCRGEGERALLYELMLIDLGSDLGQDIAGRFPELFSRTPPRGEERVRLSVLRAGSAEFPCTAGADRRLGVPCIGYALDAGAEKQWGVPPLPAALRGVSKQGEEREYRGKRLVLIEYNLDVALAWFALSDRVDKKS